MQRPAFSWRTLAIWLVVLLPVAAVLLVTFFAIAQPGCASCHKRDVKFTAATKQAPHSGVACVACHVSPAPVDRVSFAVRQILFMPFPTFGAPANRDAASVANARCLACHKDVMTTVVTANGISIDHQRCSVGAQCTDCHSGTAHGADTTWVRTYSMDKCIACHVSRASTQCGTCHDPKTATQRTAKGIFAVTHGPDWRQNHGMGDMATCTVCHTAVDCKTCHGPGLPHGSNFIEQHPTFAESPAAKCGMCHQPEFCTSCHGLKMPHPRAFVRSHSAIAKTKPALCKRCHAAPDCTQCHDEHVHPGGAIGSIPPTTTSRSMGQ
jgi:hypothetical protein